MATVGVAIEDKPVPNDFKLFGSPDFLSAISAVSSLVFAFSGTPAFFQIVSEMREPRHYNRSLVSCQSVVFITYLTIGTVFYYFRGSHVASPALGSAGLLIKKISYGIVLIGLIVSETMALHVSRTDSPIVVYHLT